MNIKTLSIALLLAATPAVSFASIPATFNVQTTHRVAGDGYSLDKFSNIEGVQAMTLDKSMLSMAAQMGGEVNLGNGLEGDALKAIDKLHIATGSSKTFAQLVEQDIATIKAGTTYKLVVEEKEEGERAAIFSRGDEKIITEILLFATEEGETSVVKIEGKFTPELLQSIVNKAEEEEGQEQ